MNANLPSKKPRIWIICLVLALGLVIRTAYVLLNPWPTGYSKALNATALRGDNTYGQCNVSAIFSPC